MSESGDVSRPLRATQFYAVFRTLLNVNFGLSYGRQTFLVQKKGLWEPILIAFGVGTGVVTLMAGYVALLSAMFSNVEPLGQGNMVLTLAIVAGQVFVLILGLFWVIGGFYFSRDSSILTPLPLPASTVVLARFGVVLINEYITLALVLVPAFCVYGLRSGAGLLFWITCIPVFLLTPVIPLAIDAAAAIVLMRFVNVRKSRTFFMFLGTAIFFGVYFWFQYYIMHQAPHSEADMLNYLMTVQDSLSRSVAMRFPPSLWASFSLSKAGTAAGLGNLAILVAVSAGALMLAVALGSRLFYSALAAGGEVAVSRAGARGGRAGADAGADAGAGAGAGRWARRGGQQPMAAGPARAGYAGAGAADLALPAAWWVQRSPEVAIALKDMWLFVRTPTFLLNGLANVVVFPGLMAVWFIAGGGAGAGNPFAEIPGFAGFMAAPEFAAARALVFAAVIVFVSGINAVASSGFSRDGLQYWVYKVIPVSFRRQVIGKIMFTLAFQVLSMLPLVVVMELILRLDLAALAMGVLIGVAGSTWASLVSLYIDMMRPYLTWDNPQRAMKSNLNALIAMAVVTVIAAGAGYAVIKVLSAGFDQHAVMWCTFVFFAALSVLSYRLLMAGAERAFRRVEL
jgi:ABC-2 type transport system permease protein